MTLKGIVLAGGKSSRFGGDKALALWEGTTLLERAVHLLAELDLHPEVIANPAKNYAFLARPVHNDVLPEKGPLGGLYTAFSLFPESALLVLTCDMPLLNQETLKELARAHRDAGHPVVFEVDRIRQPFPGIYPGALKQEARECLDAGRLSMKNFLSRIPDLRTLPEPANTRTFSNINTLEDLTPIQTTHPPSS